MRITATSIALLALPTLIHADPDSPVALIDFKPRVENVSGACSKVYEKKVPGCAAKDFTQQGCSVECLKGLDSMTKLVKDACSDDGLLDSKEQGILAYFLKGDGPQALCTNANKVLQSLSSSPAESTTSKQSSSTPSSTQQQTTTSIASSTATASSTDDVPTSIVMATSTSSESSASTSSDSTASSTTSQIFQAPSMPSSWSTLVPSTSPTSSPNGHSGGGSPFDAEGNEFSAASSTTSSAVMLTFAVIFAGLAARW